MSADITITPFRQKRGEGVYSVIVRKECQECHNEDACYKIHGRGVNPKYPSKISSKYLGRRCVEKYLNDCDSD